MVIAIHAPIGVGKNFTGQYLSQNLMGEGYVTENISFALKLKKSIAEHFDLRMQKVDHEYTVPYENFSPEDQNSVLIDMKPKPMSLGRVLQQYATEGVRDGFNKDFWALGSRASALNSNSDVFFITDLRFDNEVHFLRENFPQLLLLKLTGEDHRSQEDSRDKNHPSEKGVPDKFFDFVISNDGDLKQLTQKLDKVLLKIYHELAHYNKTSTEYL